MEGSGENIINHVALTTPGEGSRTSGVISGSYQVRGGRRHELNMKRSG